MVYEVQPLATVFAISSANKQAYLETLPVFFSIQEFHCSASNSLAAFARMLQLSDPRHTPNREPLVLNEPLRLSCLSRLRLDRDYGTREPYYIEDVISRALRHFSQVERISKLIATVRVEFHWREGTRQKQTPGTRPMSMVQLL